MESDSVAKYKCEYWQPLITGIDLLDTRMLMYRRCTTDISLFTSSNSTNHKYRKDRPQQSTVGSAEDDVCHSLQTLIAAVLDGRHPVTKVEFEPRVYRTFLVLFPCKHLSAPTSNCSGFCTAEDSLSVDLGGCYN